MNTDPESPEIFSQSLPFPELLLLEQSGEISLAQASTLTAWRAEQPEQASVLEHSLNVLTRPLPDPAVPLHPLQRDHILKAGRAAHVQRGRQANVPSNQPGTLLTPAWRQEDTHRSKLSWLSAVAALAAVFLFGLYVANRPSGSSATQPDGSSHVAVAAAPVVAPNESQIPGIAEQAANPDPENSLVSDSADDPIEAFINEPYSTFDSQLSELDLALFQSQFDLSDETDWLAQID